MPPVIVNETSNFIIHKDTMKTDLTKYIHACLFSPPTTTLQKAVCKGHFLSWPGTHNLNVEKLLPTSKATALRHLDQERANLQSTCEQEI
eukprot:10370045-Ditylum_brightwellii.AAC.1